MSLAVVHSDIKDAARSIRAKIISANDADGKSRKHRVVAGQELIILQKRIEAGEAGEEWRGKWWKWARENVGFKRQTMEICIRIAQADDPEAADQQHRDDATNRKRKSRASNHQETCDVTSRSPVERAIDAISKMLDALTEDEREEVFAALEEQYR